MNKKIIIACLLSSIAMAMMEMVYEGLFGVGFWSAPVLIAATILRNLQTAAMPVAFGFVPVMLGMMGHMMNSIIFSIIFIALFGRFLHSQLYGAVVGAIYALAVFFMMWFVVLPYIDPVIFNLNPVVFALSHMVWGVILGAMAARRTSQ